MQMLASSLKFVATKYQADYLGYVLMPNHIHLIIFFRDRNELSNLMRDFKKYSSIQVRRMLEKENNIDLLDKLRFEKREQKFRVWTSRFDDKIITSREDLERILDHIHNNPLQEKWGLVNNPEDYLYSSVAFYYKEKESILPVVHYREHF